MNQPTKTDAGEEADSKDPPGSPDAKSADYTQLMQTQRQCLVGYFARRRVRGHEEALAQETLLRLVRRLKERPADSEDHARNLMWLIARQVLSDHHKWLSVRAPELGAQIDLSYLAIDNDPSDIVAERELLRLLDHLMKGTDREVMEAIFLKMRGAPLRDVAAVLDRDVGRRTAPKHLAIAFAQLVVEMADRGHDGTLLDILEHEHRDGPLAVEVLRLWIEGKSPNQMAAKLGLTLAQARQLRDEVQAFFVKRLP